ncbi:hypothetical protein Cgig2_032621 [Carnegiea gigantea]|uniref:Stress enhanced protein 1 n=1 Tax=Carnegiea gigantea TaxID=171969 RepID=A0A9Q1KY98_9CARY|nr:hypothetical protein Cgig2_032621 [Carnegiea gigantea]
MFSPTSPPDHATGPAAEEGPVSSTATSRGGQGVDGPVAAIGPMSGPKQLPGNRRRVDGPAAADGPTPVPDMLLGNGPAAEFPQAGTTAPSGPHEPTRNAPAAQPNDSLSPIITNALDGPQSLRGNCFSASAFTLHVVLLARSSARLKAAAKANSASIRCQQSANESNNLDVWLGRLAMVGFAVAISVEISTGKGLLENFGLTTPLPTVALAVTVLVGVLTAVFIFQSASKN